MSAYERDRIREVAGEMLTEAAEATAGIIRASVEEFERQTTHMPAAVEQAKAQYEAIAIAFDILVKQIRKAAD